MKKIGRLCVYCGSSGAVEPLPHFEAQTKSPCAPAVQGIEEWVFPDCAEQVAWNVCRHKI
jgi:hypothetical protein